MPHIGLFLKLLNFAASLLALWTSWRERQAGRNEAILEQREATDAAIRKADGARASRRERDAEPDGLRENDGYRRD